MSTSSQIIDQILVTLDARGRIETALEVVQIACETLVRMKGSTLDSDDRVAVVKAALLRMLSGPDEELYTADDMLPESVMRDLVSLLNSGVLEQLVQMFTAKKHMLCCFG